MTYFVVVLFVVADLVANKFHEKDAMSYHTFGSVVSVIHLREDQKTHLIEIGPTLLTKILVRQRRLKCRGR